MAQLTMQEFTDVITILADHMGMQQFHNKLLKANALVSRKRPSKVETLATQLYQLSAGLRRDHAARYAVELLWQEMVSSHIPEEQSKTVDALAERVNENLSDRLEVIPDKTTPLLSALGAYYQGVAALASDNVAYLEMLMRATTDVARFLREHKAELATVEVVPPEPQEGEAQAADTEPAQTDQPTNEEQEGKP